MDHKKFLQGVIVGGLAFVLIFIANQTIAQKINFGSIKPAVTQNQLQQEPSYEQQSILAVRGIKPSVVDIVGNSSTTDSSGNISAISGTGFIISSDGLIVSNNHVVSDSNIKYTVVFSDGSQYDAKVLGLDKLDDVALLKIDAKGLPVAKLGDSGTLETGQTVFAVGNSLGKYQNSVTRGVVSGLGRSIDVGDGTTPLPRLQNLIQTDAAINPGNSGGPLVNLAGEVVGMDTLIDTGGESLGFAVSINTIKSAVDQLQKYGKVSKPYMGINFLTINKAVQALKKLSVSDGALVDSVVSGGPADKAGIKAGDIITQVDQKKLTSANPLDTVISNYQAGNQITITLLRNGKQEEVPLILGEFK